VKGQREKVEGAVCVLKRYLWQENGELMAKGFPIPFSILDPSLSPLT
jgi:hypothetical protein